MMGGTLTSWSYTAVFLSEGTNDGYVEKSGMTKTPYPAATPEPGIWAGRGATGAQQRGFLSFDTSSLNGAQVLAARLRLYQRTNNDGYEALGSCQVDIRKGVFNGSVALEGMDFAAADTHDDAAQVRPLDLATQSVPDWVEAELGPLTLDAINTGTTYMGHTQFRIHFDGTTNNKQVKWNSGDSTDTQPQLIVRYQP